MHITCTIRLLFLATVILTLSLVSSIQTESQAQLSRFVENIKFCEFHNLLRINSRNITFLLCIGKVTG